tara:strand:- start:127 stop:249 length:123 start_codon:yes stop_codon:yes gene_type:complete
LFLALNAVFLSSTPGLANEDFEQLMGKNRDEWDQKNTKKQ